MAVCAPNAVKATYVGARLDNEETSQLNGLGGSTAGGGGMPCGQAGPLGLGSDGAFRCITCKRGPPHTKKYAKNQCQTCYKKDKKIQRSSVGGCDAYREHLGGLMRAGAWYR